jgi:hypothetical protein
MSWWQLLDIAKEAAELARDEQSRPPIACEDDGEPLISAEGKLYCKFCGRLYEG